MERAQFLGRPDPDLTSIHDAADSAFIAQARDELTHRILSGKHKAGIFELLESEVNQEPSCRKILGAITDLLLNETGEREALADQIRDGLVERYLDSHTDLVMEEAETIEAESE